MNTRGSVQADGLGCVPEIVNYDHLYSPPRPWLNPSLPKLDVLSYMGKRKAFVNDLFPLIKGTNKKIKSWHIDFVDKIALIIIVGISKSLR